jgi:hypothetical protein
MRRLSQISLWIGALLLLPANLAYPTNAAQPQPSGAGSADCGSSCARPEASEYDTPPSPDEFIQLLEDWSAEALASPSLALETLLFHNDHSLTLLDQLPLGVLAPARSEFLRSELRRNRAKIELRIVDEEGNLRGGLSARGLALGEPTHRHLSGTGDLGEIELSGQVRRVGLDHIWSRW